MESLKKCPQCENGLMAYHSYFHAYMCDSCGSIERVLNADDKDRLIAEQQKKIEELQQLIKEMGQIIYECDYCDTCVHSVIEVLTGYCESECEIDRDNCDRGACYEYRPKSVPKRYVKWNKETKQYEPYIKS
jgi:hypothetical protein